MYTRLSSVHNHFNEIANLKKKTPVISQFNTNPDDAVFGMETVATQ